MGQGSEGSFTLLLSQIYEIVVIRARGKRIFLKWMGIMGIMGLMGMMGCSGAAAYGETGDC